MIKAPYNFVPLAQKVVFPDWAPKISMDRPFEDGISGTIDVRYTAQTPIFVGNGKENDEENAPILNYKAANGKYAIPGSSLRGMLRNVIEIASFGKFNRVSDEALSVRDLTPAAKDLYRKYFTNKTIKGGWLVFENGAWVLYPVSYYRVEDSDVEKCYSLKEGCLKRKEEFDDRVKRLKNNVKVFFSAEEKLSRIKLTEYPSSKSGFVVLTGNPGGKKHLDFVFENKGSQKIIIGYETILQFKQTNVSKASDQKRGLNLAEKLRNCKEVIRYPGIPVFYLPDDDGNPDSLGLSMMYRLPYKNSLHDAIKHSSETHFSDKMDLAECVFGKISNEENMSLRGRIQLEDATTNSNVLAQQVDTILGNPKPTYYPNYIQQGSNNLNYKTLMDKDVILRGWKRYPVKNTLNPMPVGDDQRKVASHFSPLQKGTVFEGKIHFHNLKKVELGALLWAITWGNNKNLSHSVGMGKPYGFGQIKADISSLSYLKNDSESNDYNSASENETDSWIKTFESFMEENAVGWKNSEQLKELKEMADPKNAERRDWVLSHMSLSIGGDNEFVSAKKHRSFLSSYSSVNQETQLVSNHGNRQGRRNNFGNGNRNNGGWNNRDQSSSPQKVARSEAGITNGSVQICILLEEKTKKLGWKARVKNVPNISGPITNTAEVPADKKPGDEIKLKIAAVNKEDGKTLFRYEQ